MNIQIIESSDDRPPINLTTEEGLVISRNSRVHPFKAGDAVVPKLNLIPIFAEGTRPSHKISEYRTLIVKSAISKGDQHYIEFNDKLGKYDALFFVNA